MFSRCTVGLCLKSTIAVLFTFQLLYIPLTIVLYWNQSAKPDPPTPTPSPGPEWMTTAEPANETLEYFLWEYNEYCRLGLFPKKSNVAAWRKKSRRRSAEICDCVPDTLVGFVNRSTETPLIGELELRHSELSHGGEWMPTTCIPRQRVAIIIPFRDREEHLSVLLSILHPMLQRQQLHYTIFVIEQHLPDVFNKAALMNAGFSEARRLADFDCYVFHDVDMIPLHDHNFYTCSEMPRHIGSNLDKFNFTLPYLELFGGVTGFTADQFIQVNGYSNQYYGWGGEDDDMYSRIVAQNLSITRFSPAIARYSMIRHKSDEMNPANARRFGTLYHRHRLSIYQQDGLNSVRYKLNTYQARPLYVWLQISLPPHPPYFQNTYLINRSAADVSTRSSGFTLAVCVLILVLAFDDFL